MKDGERFPKEAGIPPVRLFELTRKAASFNKEPSSEGIWPEILLLLRSMFTSSEQFIRLIGSLPPNMLWERLRCCCRYKWPTSGGISPKKLLLARLTSLRKVRFPMDGDIDPLKSWPCTMTLAACNSSPVAEMNGVVPRAHDSLRAVGYGFFDVE